MEHSPEHSQHAPAPSSSSSFIVTNLPSSSSSSSGVYEGEEEENNGHRNDENLQHHHHQHQEQQQHQQSSGVSYHLNISISAAARIDMRDDIWSCVIVLITFWSFASMTLILGYYGSVTLQLGPNCSRLMQPNSVFVQSIQVEELDKRKPGLMLYGLERPPPSDVEISWIETHDAFVPANFRKWLFFLNKGSKVNISYTIKSAGSSPLSLVIAQGKESFLDWVEDPSYPTTSLSWNIINGSGKIQQEIPKSSNYYIAVGNLNSEEVEIQLKFSINALIYDTTQAYYRCSLGDHLCTLKLYLLGEAAAVLSSPGRSEETPNSIWYVKVTYGPRWITYFVGSGVMTILILLALRFCKMFQTRDGPRLNAGEMESERAPLLPAKDDDISSWGSSYESVSHDEEDLEQWLAVTSVQGKPLNEGESNNPRHLCVICFDAPRDCFFLPCGHCATCFTCGTRIAEDAGTCPICRRKMKKVRKVFTV
ncbi:uncharacterized protein LOC111302127 [Durio zibethinus]|uniref:Uncharacterized protein LOC111302127 n=1 Tax=Durio zibethinus TaxID=66656 RepID=A0A6P5ZLU4_DURZI|nr:uncharacterized protein LOC111302127 [Durio zibethinus]